MTERRRPHAVRVPRRLRVPPLPSNRAPIPADALAACYGAHAGATHSGRRGYACDTCQRYVQAIVDARAAERTQP